MPDARTACPSATAIKEYLAKGSRFAEYHAVREHLAGFADCRLLLSRVTPTSADAHAPTLAAPVDASDDGDANAGDKSGVFTLVTVDQGRYKVGREIARGGMGRIFE